MKYLIMVIFLSIPITAQAAWTEPGMNPTMTPQVRIETQHHVQSSLSVQRPVPIADHQQRMVSQPQVVRHDRPMDRPEAKRHEEQRAPEYFRRDVNYYQHAPIIYPYADIDTTFVVPDGFEAVIVNGETFYYNDGSFYQEVGNELTAIPAVLGAVVDSIPTDYQIVMAGSDHYLFTRGVFYQRVDQGFEVVQAPVIDQE